MDERERERERKGWREKERVRKREREREKEGERERESERERSQKKKQLNCDRKLQGTYVLTSSISMNSARRPPRGKYASQKPGVDSKIKVHVRVLQCLCVKFRNFHHLSI